MEFIDIIVTPYYIFLLFIIAYAYRSSYRQEFLIQTYFLKAYLLRIFGGIAFAGVYFFYYDGGGDTFAYFRDSKIVASALRNDFFSGLELLFDNSFSMNSVAYKYSYQIYSKHDVPSMSVVRVAAVLNIFTFDSFLSTTILFSLIGFFGSWRLFLTLCRMFPNIHKELAIGCLYLPSIIFWASGIMKDTICTAALCILFSEIVSFFVFKERKLSKILVSIVCFYILITIKIYIAMCFVPAISFFLMNSYSQSIKSVLIRTLVKPFFYGLSAIVGYYGVSAISAENTRYNLEEIEGTAISTAEYIGRMSLQQGGSYYSLGKLDFSLTNIPTLVVKAFVVTFYRPFLWELRAPLMIFSTLEGLYFMYLSYLFFKYILFVKKMKNVFTPFTSFCFLFSIAFAFSVGVSSNNFGTLARYKALMLPFFVCGVYVTIKEDSGENAIRY